MINYWLLWMGPINKDWIDKNGSCWCAGRIEASWSEGEDNPYGIEYAVPPMHCNDWKEFSTWLMHHQTEEVETLQMLCWRFELHRNKVIEWFVKERCNA